MGQTQLFVYTPICWWGFDDSRDWESDHYVRIILPHLLSHTDLNSPGGVSNEPSLTWDHYYQIQYFHLHVWTMILHTCTDSTVVLLTLPISHLWICCSKMCPFGHLATVNNVKKKKKSKQILLYLSTSVLVDSSGTLVTTPTGSW